MPRGKTPSLLSTNNGGITFEAAQRSGSCNRCKAKLHQGDKIGLMKVTKAGFTNLKRTCLTCVKAITAKTQEDLDAIKLEAAA